MQLNTELSNTVFRR